MQTFFHRFSHSIATRLIVVGVLVVVVASATRYVLMSRWVREDLQTLVSNERLAIANLVASSVDDKLVERRDLLQRMARQLPADVLGNPPALQALLAERQALLPLFFEGLQVIDRNGRMLAAQPPQPAADRPGAGGVGFVAEALAGRFALSPPGVQAGFTQPGLSMAVPVRDASGAVSAVLVGTASLAALDLLNTPANSGPSSAGGLLLVSPRDGVFVASSDPSLVLAPLPPPGINLLHDRAMQGYRGTGITVNARGVEELAAMVSVPSTGWFVVARIPTSSAFAAIESTKALVKRATLISLVLVLLLVGVVTWWMLGPLFQAVRQADAMTRGDAPLEPLKVVREDEIGQLMTSFNRLIAKLASTQNELLRLAHHDSLTGLPNRRLLGERLSHELARSRRRGTALALLVMDLDGFKPINDQHGHEVGDEALRLVADRFAHAVREGDTLARVGGDEFVLLVTDLAGSREEVVQSVSVIADKLVDIAAQLQLKGTELRIGVSIGVALSASGHEHPDALLNAGDRAMYEAKQAGRGRHVFTHGVESVAPLGVGVNRP